MKEEKDIIQSFVKIGCECSNNGYHLYDIQKWLREVKKIFIQIDYNYNENKYDFYTCSDIESKLDCLMEKISNEFKLFETYEEALEAGIWEAYYLINN